jgi:hypothetical protein
MLLQLLQREELEKTAAGKKRAVGVNRNEKGKS